MSALEATLKYLYELQFFGMKLGLDNTVALLEFMHNPHRRFPVVHVAGTNGKGSTCAMLAAMFQAAGFRTGLYTSPHLRRFSERIRVNGQPVGENDIIQLTDRMRPSIDNLRCTFFEATTVMAFEYFAASQVDVAIVETGLGGRLDATNVVDPLVSVITNIDLEHTEHLGETLAGIAFEKGGIIKPATPCVIGPVDESCRDVFDRLASERQARLTYFDDVIQIEHIQSTSEGGLFDVRLVPDHFELAGVAVHLHGRHQVTNAALAILTLHRQPLFLVPDQAVRLGLQQVVWKGRLQWLEPHVLVDAAHNPAGLRRLRLAIEEFGETRFQRVILIIGMLADKDFEAAMDEILPACDEVIAVTPESPRALPAGILADLARNWGRPAHEAGSVSEAIATAKKQRSRDDLIVITGSHFVLSEIENL